MVSNQEQQLGKYRVLRLLGRGGFADVYLGQHLYLKSYAALKVLRTSLEDEDVTKFMTEAQTLARLVHPQIVRVLDFDVIRGSPMLVMEYSPGGTLRQRHPRGECLSLETTVTYVKQIAAALHYAHQHDVMHRDVKPENMLLGDHQVVRLSDFGLALLAPSPEQLSTQEMSGTIPYMAPEQLQGKPRPASDQYALGIVAYEWLCGVRPFEGNYWQLAHQHISVPPPPLREKDPSLPASVEAVVLKALAKDPQQRYGSVHLFAQAFEQAAQAAARDLSEAFEATAPLRAVSPVTPVASATTPRRVFFSAFPSDAPFVARLSADLQARGITIWSAPLAATQPQSDARDTVRQAMRAVDALLVVAAPGAQSSRLVKHHLQLAALYKRPIIYLQTSGDERIDTLPLLEHISIIDAHPARYAAALDEMVACLERELSHASDEEAAPPAEERTPRNPYTGLRAFRAGDAQDFFGRDALIAELSDTLRELLSSPPAGVVRERLLAVVGPSGSGKSSVVMAGLLPRLTGGALPGSDGWVYLEPMVPGTHPIEALALALAPHLSNRSVASIREDLQDDAARGLHRLATQLVKTPDQKVVLLVDQFEELFTLTSSEAERQQFIDLLVTAAAEPRGPLVVILTLRADFYDRPFAYPELGRLILCNQCGVLPMEMHELRAAVRQPAALPDVHLSFEGSLIGDLLYEVQGQAGALPLLEFTLDQLFQRRSSSQLTLAAYRDIGGVKGALARHAEETYAALPSDTHRALARALFLRLIDPGYTERDTTRRRAPLDELTLEAPEENERLQQVTAYFLAARLLTSSEVAGVATAEVSHEALIREWQRLSDWLWEAREDVRLQQALSEDVAEWEQRDQPGDRLYRGSQLKEARVWARRNLPSKQEAVFLRASAARRVRSVGSLLVVLLLVAASLGTAGWFLTHQAPDPTRVTNLQDHGPGSLRQAIDVSPPGSTVTFEAGLSGTIRLTTRDLNIGKNLTIRGPVTHTISVSSGTSGLFIHVLSGISVTISNLVFKDSKPSKPIAGFILNEGTLTLSDSTVSGNTSKFGGGGIFNGGTLTLNDSTVSGNSGGSVSVEGADGVGGGISNYGTLTLSDSTVSGNTSKFGGGGIFNGGTLTLSNSTVSGNSGGSVDIYNCGGGGICNVGRLTITFSTITNNTAPVGADIAVAAGSSQHSQVTISNSIVAGDHPSTGPDISGMLTSRGYNVFQDNSGASFDPSMAALHRTDKLLSANDLFRLFVSPVGLRNNGGPTATYALAPNSPAIDAIPLANCHINGITTDQRGFPRPDGNERTCDIGAYESVY